MAHKRRAILVFGALVVVAVQSAGRRLVAFNETHATIPDTNSSENSNFARSAFKDQEETTGGVTNGVSMMKRPTIRTTALEAGSMVKNETESETPMETQAPMTVSVPTPISEAPIPLMDMPAAVGQVDMPIPTIPSSYGSLNSSLATDAPAAAEWISTDAVVISPGEATVLPLITLADRAVSETGSADSSSGTRSAGTTDERSTLPASFDSSGSNDTVTISSASGIEGAGGGTIPGQVHARLSADVSLNGSSKDTDIISMDSFRFQGAKLKKGMSSSSGDTSGDCSTSCSEDGSREQPSSDTTQSSDGDKCGLARGLLNPDVNASSANFYSLGTGSIFAIVGVIAGIMGLLLLFVAISRKQYTADDDEAPLYGYNMEIHSGARLSRIFKENDTFMESGNNGTALMVTVPLYQYDGVSPVSRESSDKVPSLRGHMMAHNHSGDISVWSRAPSMHISNRDVDNGNMRMSALSLEGSSMTSDSEVSGSWSSVLASDTERYTLRNTRDTSLSAWSATNSSPFGSTVSDASGMYGMTRASFADFRQKSGSDSSRSSPCLNNHLAAVGVDSTDV